MFFIMGNTGSTSSTVGVSERIGLAKGDAADPKNYVAQISCG